MDYKKKVLCVGDSTSLPGHTNLYEDTWYFKLKMSFSDFDFISFFKRGLSTDVLVTEGGGNIPDNVPYGADCLEYFQPEIIILQLGIVDCSPRLLNIFDKIIIKLLPINLKGGYIKVLKLFKKRKSSNTIVSPLKFENNLLEYAERCLINDVKALIILSIPFPDKRMINKNPQIVGNINKYNGILKKISLKYDFIYFINVLDARNNMNIEIYEDGYHPNPYGNELVYKSLKEILKFYSKRCD